MEYRVRWFDAAAQKVREELLRAASTDELKHDLQARGALVLSAVPARAAVARRRSSGADFDVAWWCRELGTLLKAGMTVVEALETLHAQPLGRARSKVHSVLLAELQQGRSLSAAMLASGAFPSVLVAGVKGSERTGALVPALEDFMRYHEMLERLRKQLVSAAIYPAIVVTLGLVVALFLLLFVIPRFSRMYGELHGNASMTTQLMLGLSRLLASHGTEVALASLALAVIAGGAWRSGLFHRWGVRLIEAVPLLRRYADEFRLAKLYQALAVMFRGGYALDEALAHCEGLQLGEAMSRRVARARQSLARGQRLSQGWSEAGLADEVTQRLLAVGERTGNFDRVLATIADRHAMTFTTFVERATRIVEPLMLLAVALVVGGIVVAMYMPVFDIASSVR